VSPSTVAQLCLCLRLKRAARAVARRYDDALRPLDLNNGQFSMLTVVAGRSPVGVQALADELAMDRTTVTAALKPLQRRGLVDVVVSAHDARGRDVVLLPDGRKRLSEAMPIWQSLQDELAGELSAGTFTSLHRQLAKVG
jgi:DNA-binding MarR family transcriptional regulator